MNTVSSFRSVIAPEQITALKWVGEDQLIVAGLSVMCLYRSDGNPVTSIAEGTRKIAWRPGTKEIHYVKLPPPSGLYASACIWNWETRTNTVISGVQHTCCCALDPVGNFAHGGEYYEWGYFRVIDTDGNHIDGTDSVPILLDMAFSPDGSQLLAGGRWSHLSLRSVPLKDNQEALVIKAGSIVNAVAWSDNARYIAAGLAFGQVEVWEAGTVESIGISPGPAKERRYLNPVLKIRFMPGSEDLIIYSTNDETCLYNWRENKYLQKTPQCCCFDISPSGQHIALGGTTGEVYVNTLTDYINGIW